MASIAATHEQGISPGSIPLADAFVPASIFAPEQGGCGDDDGDECFEDGDMMNGEPEDRGVDFTNKVKLGPVYYGAAKRKLAVHGDEWIEQIMFLACTYVITKHCTLPHTEHTEPS